MPIDALKILPAAAIAVLLAGSVSAQDAGEDSDLEAGEFEQCIRVSEVRNTSVIDDRTILFHLRRGDVYRNRLRSSCRGLTRGGGRFSYTARGGRLCSVDTITVPDPIDRTFRTGATCRLGVFEALSERQVELLVAGGNEADNGLVTVTEIELPEQETETESDQ